MTRKSHNQWAKEPHPPEDLEDTVYRILIDPNNYDSYERIHFKDLPSRGFKKEVRERHGQHWVVTESGEERYAIKCRPPWEIEGAIKNAPKDYPWIYKLGLNVTYEDSGPPYVDRIKLREFLKSKGESFEKKYSDLFGIQTCRLEGPYPWDVEAVFARMFTGRKTGTQLIWD